MLSLTYYNVTTTIACCSSSTSSYSIFIHKISNYFAISNVNLIVKNISRKIVVLSRVCFKEMCSETDISSERNVQGESLK